MLMNTKKTAILTGVSGGIGKATAEKFLGAGYCVFGIGRKSREEADLPVSENFFYIRGDITHPADRDRLIDAALSKNPRIDVLVNVAGVAPRVRRDILEMTEESYDEVMTINTKSLLFFTQKVANLMKENEIVDGTRGHICNISSLSAYTSSPSRGEYCISKAGVSMVTLLFADRLAEYAIPVNEVRPGIIATGMTEKVKEKYDRLIEGGLLPEKRWGRPEDVAAAVFALCSGELTYVTGQSIDVDGGFHIKRL